MKNFGPKTTDFAIKRPRLIVRGMLIITLILMAGAGLPTLFPNALGFLPQVTIDTDPENMLPADHPARVYHNESKERFNLHDAVILGVVNETHESGVFNPQTLKKVYQLTEFAKELPGVITGDLMAPSTTDSIENTGPGSVSFGWLMPAPPTSQEEALAVRDRAMRIPFLRDTMISIDGKALVIYIPIEEKDMAHEISTALRAEIASLEKGSEQYHIAGLPVAEDTFGIEMFIQMAISAPMAMLVIFLLMWFYFRRLSIIISPMLVAMAAALSTMGLLVITGNTVHIMSSMIPIFIMPIAVLDAVHIISDFFDTYPSIGDRKKTIQKVMGHLFSPMLFTSLTTAAGFASLALTPIPPVQVFGLFIAFGVIIAWLFTILFVPAYIMLLSPKRLEGFGRVESDDSSAKGPLAMIGQMRGIHAKLILVAGMGLVVVAVIGIQKINVNDNPTKWFEEGHEIRIADKVLNEHFGGTYDAYLEIRYKRADYSADSFTTSLSQSATNEQAQIAAVFTELATSIAAQKQKDIFGAIDELDAMVRKQKVAESISGRRIGWSLAQDFLADQFEIADTAEEEESEEEDSNPQSGIDLQGAMTMYVKNIAAQYTYISQSILVVGNNDPKTRTEFLATLANSLADRPLAASFVGRQEQTEQVFKSPEMLAYMEGIQTEMNKHASVGKSNSLADIVKVVHRDLLSGDEKDYRLPNTSDVVAQTLIQYQSSHRKDDLWHFVSSDYSSAIIWFQLKSGDNQDMQSVIASLDTYLNSHPAPIEIETPQWFGLAYINVVWQQSMVTGMVNALLGSFVIVLIMMIVLFRSVLWGLLSMIPLTLTVALIYGILGLVGKDYDMPVAVLSSLSLGLAVDYSIHFLSRARELQKLHGSWRKAQSAVFEEPARAISRNVVVIGVGFLPLLLAPLVPYQTVGLLIASILFAAGLATLLLLPALIHVFESLLFPKSAETTKDPS